MAHILEIIPTSMPDIPTVTEISQEEEEEEEDTVEAEPLFSPRAQLHSSLSCGCSPGARLPVGKEERVAEERVAEERVAEEKWREQQKKNTGKKKT